MYIHIFTLLYLFQFAPNSLYILSEAINYKFQQLLFDFFCCTSDVREILTSKENISLFH